MEKSKQQVAANIRKQFRSLSASLNERTLRLWAGSVAISLGRGGSSRVSEATGLSRPTIRRGIQEAIKESSLPPKRRRSDRTRESGGGRKKLDEDQPGLKKELRNLLCSSTRGDPMSPLVWTSKSTRRLAQQLTDSGYPLSQRSVWTLLREMGYTLQRNSKTLEGKQHADRDAQFEFISRKSRRFMSQGDPVISVDTKKKEKIGRFKNDGREWHKAGNPEKVKTHDFIEEKLGKVSPYGVYDVHNNVGWVSVGVDHDTAEFSTSTIRTWWIKMGRKNFPASHNLYVTADSGGSNSSRGRLWKTCLQSFATEFHLNIHVSHFPPGTSKWNKIEHRMFSFITANWRNKPLTSQEVVVNLIANTTTKKGLRIKSKLDKRAYPKGISVTDEEIDSVNLHESRFHGEWNYIIRP